MNGQQWTRKKTLAGRDRIKTIKIRCRHKLISESDKCCEDYFLKKRYDGIHSDLDGVGVRWRVCSDRGWLEKVPPVEVIGAYERLAGRAAAGWVDVARLKDRDSGVQIPRDCRRNVRRFKFIFSKYGNPLEIFKQGRHVPDFMFSADHFGCFEEDGL